MELKITDLHVEIAGREILSGVNLTLKDHETIALLGPNGHGKSTLLSTIMGHPSCQVTQGCISLDGKDVLSLTVDERSKAGLFLAMQSPLEIPGVNSADFYRSMMNVRREKPMKLFEFYNKLQTAYSEVGIPFEMSNRSLNDGFSGGEKKRNEILQMKLLDPSLIMLDEIDSGLDVDAITTVASAINEEEAKGKGFLIVSHYARLYELLRPTKALIMVNGKIVLSGGPELINRIDKEGYEWLKKEHGIILEKPKRMNETSIGACSTKIAIEGK